jgi:hypothetical protein
MATRRIGTGSWVIRTRLNLQTCDLIPPRPGGRGNFNKNNIYIYMIYIFLAYSLINNIFININKKKKMSKDDIQCSYISFYFKLTSNNYNSLTNPKIINQI